MTHKTIQNILDVPHVEGIFIFDKEGNPLFEHLPDYNVAEKNTELARRVINIYDVMEDNFQKCSDFFLKFTEKNIFIRRTEETLFLIISNSNVNFVSLKLVTKLALKQLNAKDLQKKEKPAAKPKKSKLTYRGSTIDENPSVDEKPDQEKKKSRFGLTYRGSKL